MVNRLRPSKVASFLRNCHHGLVGCLVGDLLEALGADTGKGRSHPPDLVAGGAKHHLVQAAHGVVLTRPGEAEGLDPVLRLGIGQIGGGRHAVVRADQAHGGPGVSMGARILAASSGGHPRSTS